MKTLHPDEFNHTSLHNFKTLETSLKPTKKLTCSEEQMDERILALERH